MNFNFLALLWIFHQNLASTGKIIKFDLKTAFNLYYCTFDLDTLFDYGIEFEDKLLAVNESQSMFNLSFDFPYFGRNFINLSISKNGYVAFNYSLDGYTKNKAPFDANVIAPLNLAFKSSENGSVFYRQIQNHTQLNRIAMEINQVYSPTSAFIVTWDSVVVFYNQAFTFQMVISTDGFDSYLTANYKNCSPISNFSFYQYIDTNNEFIRRSFIDQQNYANQSISGEKWIFNLNRKKI